MVGTLDKFFSNLNGLEGPYTLNMGAVNKGNFNLGNYVNQTDYSVDKSRRFAMKAGSNSIVGLNASITLKTSNV